MSHVLAAPDLLSAAVADLAGFGSALSAANLAAAAPTTGVLAAGADEVSAAVESLFAEYAREYQALSTELAAFHQQFVQVLTSSAGSYVAAEAANASPLQSVEQGVLGLINAPSQTLLGRPLIGDGSNGAAGPGRPVVPAGCCTATAASAGPERLAGPAGPAVMRG